MILEVFQIINLFHHIRNDVRLTLFCEQKYVQVKLLKVIFPLKKCDTESSQSTIQSWTINLGAAQSHLKLRSLSSSP